ncbi:MAG: PCP reductase family protein [Nitrospirales bacterium]|nr:PCP reductase family protein [Nitrospira sp.]MDR4500124.1 PCP reductase family protein [Nitrospirales bacterium]
MNCDCGRRLEPNGVDELDATTCLARFRCEGCGRSLGIEGEPKEVAPLFTQVCWTDEALHMLDRLPPYSAPFYRDDVERYARVSGNNLVTFDFLGEAKNQGTVSWSQDTIRRLERVPPAIRAMAKVELERTALERGMTEVTVELMEEIKARYFGMGNPKTQNA